jgi:hypothetical protein
METTRGNLVPATIYEADDFNVPKSGLEAVFCMFNPYEYTVSKSNSFMEKPKHPADTPQGELFKAGVQTLKLNLIFDTYETGDDVSVETNKLWKFMMTKTKESNHQDEKIEPPQVAFQWGAFRFVAYITSMTQTFTLFTNKGRPVRAKVDVTFTQYNDVNDYDYRLQNPTSRGLANERIHQVVSGDRLDAIAWETYRDSTKWRAIAAHNGISNPLALRPGQRLRIPFD